MPVRWVQVAAGGLFTCALASTGTLWCWGTNDTGELGDGTTTPHSLPNQVGAWDDWTQVTTGYFHACAIRKDNSLWCWGCSNSGMLGDETGMSQSSPTQVVGPSMGWSQVSAASFHTCAVRVDGTLWCWGDSDYGEVGDGSTNTYNAAPAQESTGAVNWTHVASSGSYYHTCALRMDDTLWCWGKNYSGQLGGGVSGWYHSSPQAVLMTDWAQVALGGDHTCAIKTDGTLWCWGDNERGQLGDGTYMDHASPTQEMTGTKWAQVSGGVSHTCALRSDGTLWCWGDNEKGQLGDGQFGGPPADGHVPRLLPPPAR